MAEVLRDVSENITTSRRLGRLAPDIVGVAMRAVETIKSGGKILIFGNGGSAADAQHITGELMGKYLTKHTPYAAIALTTNTSNITAIANDFAFAEVFARQVEALARPGDLVIGISTSGRSENVIRGVRQARKMGVSTAALTGGSGGRLAPVVDRAVIVPSTNTQRIQEAHALIGHVICKIVELQLKKSRPRH